MTLVGTVTIAVRAVIVPLAVVDRDPAAGIDRPSPASKAGPPVPGRARQATRQNPACRTPPRCARRPWRNRRSTRSPGPWRNYTGRARIRRPGASRRDRPARIVRREYRPCARHRRSRAWREPAPSKNPRARLRAHSAGRSAPSGCAAPDRCRRCGAARLWSAGWNPADRSNARRGRTERRSLWYR